LCFDFSRKTAIILPAIISDPSIFNLYIHFDVPLQAWRSKAGGQKQRDWASRGDIAPAAHSKFQISYSRLAPAAQFKISYSRFQISACGAFQISDFRFKITRFAGLAMLSSPA